MGNDMEKNRQQGGQQQSGQSGQQSGQGGQQQDRQGNQQDNWKKDSGTGQDRRPDDVSKKNPGQSGNQSDEDADRDLEKRRAS